MIPQLNTNDKKAMTFICSILGAMNEKTDIGKLREGLDEIINDWELDDRLSEVSAFGNLYAKGKGIDGTICVKVNRVKLDKEPNVQEEWDYWLSVHTAKFVVSKEVYNNLLSFAKRIERGIWGQPTEFKWQEKDLPLGAIGKASLNKGNVFLLF